MTFDQALACLRELRALERLQRAVQEMPAPSFEWRCGLAALDDRRQLLRHCLSREEPALLAAVEERYRLELLSSAGPPEAVAPAIAIPDVPPGARVH